MRRVNFSLLLGSLLCLLALMSGPISYAQNQLAQPPGQANAEDDVVPQDIVFSESLNARRSSSADKLAVTKVSSNRSTAKNNKSTPEPKTLLNPSTEVTEIQMFVGETRVFPAPGVSRIAVGNGRVMSAAALDGREVIVFANAIGTSSVFVWKADGNYQRIKVNIVAGDTVRIEREIAAFLSTIPNTRASVVGDKVIVEGENLSDIDQEKIALIAGKYPQIINFTGRVGWEKMILIDVKVVEFPVNVLREIGLKWGARGGADIASAWGPIKRDGNGGPYQLNSSNSDSGLPISNLGRAAQITIPSGLVVSSLVDLGLGSQLNLLSQDGQAAILAEPQLSTRSGSKAKFLAGGEIPYQGASATGTPSVFFKKYGVNLDILPRIDSKTGVIRASITTSVSDIDQSIVTAAGPALRTRETETEFNVRDGETIILSGLISRDQNQAITKVPFLGDIPILGALFRSKRFQNKETELVVFVTPTVVSSQSAGLQKRITDATQRLEKAYDRYPFLPNPNDGSEVVKLPPPSLSLKVDEMTPRYPAAPPIDPPATTLAAKPPAPAAPLMSPASSPVSKAEVYTPPVVTPVPLPRVQSTAIPRPVTETSKPQVGSVRYRVKLDQLALRDNPDKQAAVLANLKEGEVVFAENAGLTSEWLSVRYLDRKEERRGWVPRRWIEIAQ